MSAPSADDIWHTGGVASAIAEVRSQNSLLIVLTCAPETTSADADAVLARTSTRALLRTTFTHAAVIRALSRAKATCIRMDGNDSSKDFQNFRALFPVKNSPALHIIAPDGRVLVHVEFFVSPAAFVRAIDYALIARDGQTPPPPPNLGPALHTRRSIPRARVTRATQAASVAAQRKAVPRKKHTAPVKTEKEDAKGEEIMEKRSLPSADRALKIGSAPPTEARLLARLPDGRVAQRTFANDAALQSVVNWIGEELNVRVENVQLSVAFPRRVFDGGDMPKTMQELGLVPSATLIVSHGTSGTHGSGGVLASVQAGGSYLRDAVGVAGSFLSSFVEGAPPARDGEDSREERPPQQR